jgi:hypothetical protein
MKAGIHLHHAQDLTDDGALGVSSTDNADIVASQDLLPEFGASLAFAVPAATAPLTQTLYLTEPGTTNPISVADIYQGQLGDCFPLSSFDEEALFHPTAITTMIHNNGNGTETVTLYLDRSGRLPTFGSTGFKATTVTINNSFSTASVNNGAKQDVVANQKEIWPQVVEKAVATLAGGYGAIANGGNPVLTMDEPTGQSATYTSPANLTLATLQKYVAAGDLITMDTSSKGGLLYGLVSNHAYEFERERRVGDRATGQSVGRRPAIGDPAQPAGAERNRRG